jgi:hypothetical protein
MQTTYEDQPVLMDYLQTQQWPQRFEFARLWISKVAHYGNITTSPCEGLHAITKAFLPSSTGDLLRVTQAIERMLTTSYSELTKEIARQRDRVPFSIRAVRFPTIFTPDINQFIAPKALELVKKQWFLSQSVSYQY